MAFTLYWGSVSRRSHGSVSQAVPQAGSVPRAGSVPQARSVLQACGTCHMASSFLSLPRTPTSTICSPSGLLITTLAQRLVLSSPSQTSAPLPSPLARNNVNTSCASHHDQKGLTPLLALLLVSIPDALLTTYAPSPSHFARNSHHEQFNVLSCTSPHPKVLKNFIAEMNF